MWYWIQANGTGKLISCADDETAMDQGVKFAPSLKQQLAVYRLSGGILNDHHYTHFVESIVYVRHIEPVETGAAQSDEKLKE